jgi:hypothetical protein
LEWWISDQGLNVGPERKPEARLSPFDQMAGKLMSEARSRKKGKYLAHVEYENIAGRLDEAEFKLLDHIVGEAREQLAKWNQRNPRKAIKTFCGAIPKAHPRGLEGLRRAVLKRLYQAAEKFEDTRP